MLDYLKQLDVLLLVFINSLHTPFLDKCMLFITHRYTWTPLYVVIVLFLFFKRKKEFPIVLLFIIGSVVCADLFASSLMKPLFHRLRPCHNHEISSLLYLIKDNCGGRYGFISSHAANTFALATFLFLFLGKEYRWVELLFIWAAFVSLSRVYLGVHYPADIAVGALSGILIALLFYYFYTLVRTRINTFRQA
jgi:undecaprenyl-diphosphatase